VTEDFSREKPSWWSFVRVTGGLFSGWSFVRGWHFQWSFVWWFFVRDSYYARCTAKPTM